MGELLCASATAQREWMRRRLQAYRVESHQAETGGLLTAYYEPLLDAIHRRDPAAAEAATRAHLEAAAGRVLAALRASS